MLKREKNMKVENTMEKKFITNATTREIIRGEDKDYFIDLGSIAVELEAQGSIISRIQYPVSRAVLVRTSPISEYVTVHILKDVDLYSAYSNFEVNTKEAELRIEKLESKAIISIKKLR